MGTSNWQNISWCVQAIMRIQPERVLDIGVGFGRWGMVLREFGEVWFDRVTPDTWTLHVEGIEGFAKNIAPYHEAFYDEIHVGDAMDILFDLEGPWNLAILGDVLEHFVKSDGERILDFLLERADYVLVNLPLGDDWPQDEMYENPYEEHKAVWNWSDFETRPVVCSQEFLDFDERPFGGVVLSREDPKGLAEGLFGSPRQGEVRDAAEEVVAAAPELVAREPATARTRERLDALEAIRRSGAWKLVNRLRNNPLLWRLRGALGGASGRPIELRHGSEDGELRLLRVESDGSPVLWDFLACRGAWAREPATEGAFGERLTTHDLRASLGLFDHGGRVELVFESHPTGGSCEIRVAGESHEVDLRSERPRALRFDCRTGLARAEGAETGASRDASRPVAAASGTAGVVSLSPDEERLAAALQEKTGSSLAVYAPGWTGIEHSTRILFEHLHALPAEPTREERERFLELVGRAGCDNLVLSGGAVEHLHLVQEIRERAPDTRIKLLWHGSFLQVREDYAWRGLRLAIQQARQGLLHSLGFVKYGMAEAMRDLGLRASFVENYVPELPDAASKPAEGGPHLGCWVANEGWRKPPYAMAVAASRIEGAVLHEAGKSKRLNEFCRLLGLKLHSHGDGPLSHEDLHRWLKLMDLNLYVTLSECTPMLPLESLSVGTPCLVGANSHLFQDDAYLKEMLVVPIADSSDEILRCARRALGERDAIVEAYRGYATRYNARAQASVEEFLGS